MSTRKALRQLIARGNYKIALKRAKEIHSAQGTAVSEALLVEPTERAFSLSSIKT